RHRQRRIEPERLVERTRRLQPHVRVQIRQSLIVELLRLRGRCLHRVVRDTDAAPQGNRTLRKGEEAGRHGGGDHHTGHKHSRPGLKACATEATSLSKTKRAAGPKPAAPSPTPVCVLYVLYVRC